MLNLGKAKELWNSKKRERFKYALLIILLMIVFALNTTTRGFGVDTILLSISLIFIILGRGREFFRDWTPIALGFWFYESTRGLADNLGKWLGRDVEISSIANLERYLFGINDKIPTVFLQEKFPIESVPKIFLGILFFFYTSFFWIWILAGLYIWVKKRDFFWTYFITLFAFSMFDNLIYAIFPSAPPWYAADSGILSVNSLDRAMWSSVLPSKGVNFVHFWDANDLAALPSHHVAWSTFASLFLTHKFSKKMLWTFFFPIIIAVAVVYGAEHYLVDVVSGAFIATLSFLIFKNKKLFASKRK